MPPSEHSTAPHSRPDRPRGRRRADDAESEPLPLEPDEEVPDHVFAQRTELVGAIKDTADKLLSDGATRGDLKILERALKELRYAFKMFTPYRKQRKVTVFGSARTDQAAPEYAHAEKFGKRMAEEGWMVLTGAGGGIMEAAHVGAGRDMSMGVNILLPFEQRANHVIHGDPKLANLKYFFTRKLLFVKEVHGIATFPGGFGTQDEGFETLTLVQTGKRDLMPLVWVDEPGGTYWTHWQQFVNDELLEKGLISPSDTALYKITTDIEEAVDEILEFYSVYNSMRYVRGKLVLRLHAAPDDRLLERAQRRVRRPLRQRQDHLLRSPPAGGGRRPPGRPAPRHARLQPPRRRAAADDGRRAEPRTRRRPAGRGAGLSGATRRRGADPPLSSSGRRTCPTRPPR